MHTCEAWGYGLLALADVSTCLVQTENLYIYQLNALILGFHYLGKAQLLFLSKNPPTLSPLSGLSITKARRSFKKPSTTYIV